MQQCRICGQENEDDAKTCAKCDTGLFVPTTLRKVSAAWERIRPIFRWRPTSIILIFYIVLHSLNIFSSRIISHDYHGHGQMHWARFFGKGWALNLCEAILCLSGYLMMKRHTKVWLLAGALAVSGTFGIEILRWTGHLGTPHYVDPVFDALFWFFYGYAVIYALQESCRIQQRSEKPAP
ncbi:MAG: zinc ribbon domain-containing protein [Verrucomicrobia bacterium]|nr:zinc ribbon domain-containing protein [Verrucomicrobiota bacterium]